MFNERLKELRKKMNLTQKELGIKIEISDRVIGYYESGDRFPSDEKTLNKIADFFDVSVDYLLGRTNIKDAVLLENEDLPKELQEIGIEYLEVNRELKKKGLTPEDILDIINAIEKAGLKKEK